jgi:hypothetical protein
VKVILEDADEALFYGDSAVFAALAADVDDTAVFGDADVADVGADQFIGP